jgi:lysozyme
MNLGEEGTALIHAFEKCKLTAYRDQGGILTIGWGHTGPGVVEGMTISSRTADALFDADTMIAQNAINAIQGVVFEQNQFDALTAFVFNVGVHNFKSSTMYSRLASGDMNVGNEFDKWNKVRVNGELVVSQGLVHRRAVERCLYEGGDWRTKFKELQG